MSSTGDTSTMQLTTFVEQAAMDLCEDVAAHLNREQRALLAQVPSLAPTMASVIEGRIAYGRLFLPRARLLMERLGKTYPDAFETATIQHLRETLDLSL